MIKCKPDDAVELYFDGSEKLKTQSWGTSFTGNVSPSADNQYDLGASGAQWNDLYIGNNIYLPDAGEVRLGNSGDLQLYHDGTNSYINDTGTGYLILVTSNLRINNSANNEAMIHANENGAVELYHNNSKKLETASYGVSTDGLMNFNGTGGKILLADNGKIEFGGHTDLQIYHYNGDNYINIQYDAELRLTHGSDYLARFLAEGAVILYHDHSRKFETTSSGAKVTGTLETTSGINAGNHISLNDNVQVKFGNSDDFKIYHSGSHSYLDDSSGTGNLFVLSNQFEVLNTASNEYMLRCIQDGSVQLYNDGVKKLETGVSGDYGSFTVENGTNGWDGMAVAGSKFVFMGSGSSDQVGIYNDSENEWMLRCTRNAQTDLRYDGSVKLTTSSTGVSVTGALTASGNVTAFSDINLKKDVSTINNALGTVGKLRGVSYKWKENNEASIGVIAQEVEEIIPEVVHTSEHNGKEVKSVDYGKMVGVLIEAIKELKAEVEELKRAK